MADPLSLPPPLPPPEIDPSHLSLDSLKVVARLRRHGYAAYLVGGCVRDLLVGAWPKDYDVATSAHPEQIRDVFRNSRLIGRRFRLAHVYFPDGRFVEVATFRANPIPEQDSGEDTTDLLVTDDNQFGTAEEDARRRDFTVNGLFYDVIDGKVIDFVGGREDLTQKRIRTIGDPEIRLREDPVRGLRAARIAAKLGFEIDEATLGAMARHAGELPRCPAARVLEETFKILRSGSAAGAFLTLRKAGILRYLLPPIEEALAKSGDPGVESFARRLRELDTLVASGDPVSDAVMLATLLSFLPTHDLVRGPPLDTEEDEEPEDLRALLPSADEVLMQMSTQARLPRRVADRVRTIIGCQRIFHAPIKKRRRGGGFIRTPHFADALQLFEIGVRATGEHAELLSRWRARVHMVQASAEAAQARVTEPEVSGTVTAATTPVTTPADPVDPAAKPKRRRRGGRRHRKGPKAESAAETPPDPAQSGTPT